MQQLRIVSCYKDESMQTNWQLEGHYQVLWCPLQDYMMHRWLQQLTHTFGCGHEGQVSNSSQWETEVDTVKSGEQACKCSPSLHIQTFGSLAWLWWSILIPQVLQHAWILSLYFAGEQILLQLNVNDEHLGSQYIVSFSPIHSCIPRCPKFANLLVGGTA